MQREDFLVWRRHSVKNTIAYYFRKEYGKSWENIKKAQSLGYQIPSEFLDALRKASGRQN